MEGFIKSFDQYLHNFNFAVTLQLFSKTVAEKHLCDFKIIKAHVGRDFSFNFSFKMRCLRLSQFPKIAWNSAEQPVELTEN